MMSYVLTVAKNLKTKAKHFITITNFWNDN